MDPIKILCGITISIPSAPSSQKRGAGQNIKKISPADSDSKNCLLDFLTGHSDSLGFIQPPGGI